MATNLTTDDVLDDDQLPVWQPGQPFTHVLLYDEGSDMLMRGQRADMQAAFGTPPDLFNSTPPTRDTTGLLNQRYYSLREPGPGGQPTRADLYVYNGTGWGQPLVTGFVLDATAKSSKPVVTLKLLPTSLTLGEATTLSATPSSPSGTAITQVDFFDGSQKVGTSTASPWSASYTPTQTGVRSLTAVATDVLGATNTSVAQVLTVATTPTAPQNLTAIGGDNLVTLVWQTPASNGGAIITAYKVYRDSRVIGTVPAANGTTYKDSTAVNGTTYTYGIAAVNSVGDSRGSNNAEATPNAVATTPAPPKADAGPDQTTTVDTQISLRAGASTGTGLTYRWQAVVVPNGAANIGNFDQANASATFTEPGRFVIRLTVTDSSGRTATDDVAIVVSQATTTPTVYASTQSYTTTAADYSTKCGSGTTGTAVTRSATKSGYSTQDAADAAALAQAKSDAIAAIVCAVAPATPTFNTTYNPGDNISTATWNAAPGAQLLLNLPLSTNTAPNPATMLVYAPNGTQIGQFDYNGADTGLQFGVVYNGQTYANASMKLISGNITISK